MYDLPWRDQEDPEIETQRAHTNSEQRWSQECYHCSCSWVSAQYWLGWLHSEENSIQILAEKSYRSHPNQDQQWILWTWTVVCPPPPNMCVATYTCKSLPYSTLYSLLFIIITIVYFPDYLIYVYDLSHHYVTSFTQLCMSPYCTRIIF